MGVVVVVMGVAECFIECVKIYGFIEITRLQDVGL
jgi:hypothetical protein